MEQQQVGKRNSMCEPSGLPLGSSGPPRKQRFQPLLHHVSRSPASLQGDPGSSLHLGLGLTNGSWEGRGGHPLCLDCPPWEEPPNRVAGMLERPERAQATPLHLCTLCGNVPQEA